MQYMYNSKIFGDPKKITSIVHDILLDIERSKYSVDEDTRFDLKLILNELLINCHEHGNLNDCEKPISLKLTVDFNEINIMVHDQGQGVRISKKYNVQEFTTNGRGLVLVEALVDQIEYEDSTVRCKIKLT